MGYMEQNNMSKKGLLSVALIAAVGGVAFFMNSKKTENTQEQTAEPIVKSISEEQSSGTQENVAASMHSEILRAIASGDKTVAKISPTDAATELEKRAGEQVAVDSEKIDISKMHFEVLEFIAKSPASIAGIQPKAALEELVIRYVPGSLGGATHVNPTALLGALQNIEESKSVQKWADNEDAEAIGAFLKMIADEDPGSIASMAYALHNWDMNKDISISYLERYAGHAQADAFDNQSDEKTFAQLISATNAIVEKYKNSNTEQPKDQLTENK